MSTNNEKQSEILYTESPASWNTRYLSTNGFVCQLTLRANTGNELLEKANGAMTHLIENGCTPYSYGGGAGKKNNNNNSNGNQSWCPVHECNMNRWEKDGRVWFSHKVNGEWCKGRVIQVEIHLGQRDCSKLGDKW